MRLTVIILLIVLVKLSIVLHKSASLVSAKELKRLARSGKDRKSGHIYEMVSFGSSLEAFLWLVGSSSAAVLFLMLSNTRWWLAVVAILIASWLVFFWSPARRTHGWLWWTAAVLAVPLVSLLSLTDPIFSRLGKLLRFLPPHGHTGLYQKEDLIDLLQTQGRQPDNRISELEAKMVYGALTFSDKNIGQVMTPRKAARFVAATEPIGPMLMDELHKSGFTYFAVIKDSSKSSTLEVIGILNFNDLIGHEEHGTIRDVMQSGVSFINEDQTLHDALAAFLKTRHHLLVVVNNFEEVAGVISLEDVLYQILGKKISSDFENYANAHVVAKQNPEKSQNGRSDAEVIE
jgi:CBS domain containing-hemolysin-like protein